MALDRLTKVDGGGISTTSDYRVGIITASKFVGPFDGTGGNFSGVVTATNGVFSGNISAVDGNFSGNVTIGGTLTYEDVTNIDSVGLITARDGIDCNGDIDVDGHTNLDNASVAGVSTFSDKVIIGGGASRSVGWEHLLQVEHTNSLPHGISLIGNRANSYGPNLTFAKTRSASLGGNTIVQDNDTLAQLVFRGSDGVDLANISAMIGVVVDGTPAENNVPGAFEIYTGGFNKRLTIDASGNVLIGTTDNTIYNDSSGEGVVIRGGDCIDINRTSDSMLNLNRLGSDGQYINFRRDGSVKAVLSSRDNTFCIDVNGYERLRVDTNGDVLFGTTDDTIYNNSSGEGVVIRNGDCIDIARNNDNQLFLNRQGGDGYHIAFLRDGSYKSFVATRTNDFCIDVNGSERVRIDSSGRVRISNTDLTTSSKADNLIVGNTSGHTGLTIFSGTGETGNIYFGDTNTSGVENRMGTITYDHSGNYMRFSTSGNNERVRITSSGDVGISSTSPRAKLDVKDANTGQGVIVRVSADNATPYALVVGNDDHNTDANNGLAMWVGGSKTHHIQARTSETASENKLEIESYETTIQTGTSMNQNFVFDSNGDFGLGVSPNNIGSLRTLHIKGPSGQGAGIRLQDAGDTADSDDFTIYKNYVAGYLRINGSDPLIAYLNGAERLRIDSNGYVTESYQPSFAVYRAQQSWSVNNGSVMVFDASRHNIGNHYNTSNGRFTAPVSGSYQLNFYSILQGNYDSAYIQLKVSGSRIKGGDYHFSYDQGNDWNTVSYSQVLKLSANEYVEIYSYTGTGGGSVAWHGNNWQCWSGYLLG